MCAAHTPAASTHNPTEVPLWRWLLPPHPLLSFSTAAVCDICDSATTSLSVDFCETCSVKSSWEHLLLGGSLIVARLYFGTRRRNLTLCAVGLFFWFFFDMHVPSIQALCFISCSGVSRASVFPRSLSWRPSRQPSEEVGASGPASCVVSGPFRKKRPQSRETTHSCRITARGKDWERPCSEEGSGGLADALSAIFSCRSFVSDLCPASK